MDQYRAGADFHSQYQHLLSIKTKVFQYLDPSYMLADKELAEQILQVEEWCQQAANIRNQTTIMHTEGMEADHQD